MRPPSKIVMAPLCCVCGAMKKDDNHWFVLSIAQEVMLRLIHFTPDCAITKELYYCCGTACTMTFVSEFCAEQGGG